MTGTVLVTGANRGIGQGFVAAYAAGGWTAIGTARRPEPGSDLLPLDVADPHSIAALASRLDGRPIDLLINNAGLFGPRDGRIGQIDYAAWQEVIETNLYGPVRVTEALLPNLRAARGRKIVTLSSAMGSIAQNMGGGNEIYRSSKSGMNAAMRSVAMDLRSDGFAVAVISPGWVKTDMGGPGATIDVATSVAGMKRVIERLSPSNTGRFWSWCGSELPW
ncbi:MAG: SDR family oxidoreductase [Geminicoccaceae bacterium]